MPTSCGNRAACNTCRKRGKKCDGNKPICRACLRLKFDCSYMTEWAFRNLNRGTDGPQAMRTIDIFQSDSSKMSQWRGNPHGDPSTTANSLVTTQFSTNTPCEETMSMRTLESITQKFTLKAVKLDSGFDVDIVYLNHFFTHVQRTLPIDCAHFITNHLDFMPLRFAVLCLSASNLSILDAQTRSRCLTGMANNSVYSPSINLTHHKHAEVYGRLSIQQAASQYLAVNRDYACPLLIAKILLAYYYHASTNHLQYRLAVWDAYHFVHANQQVIIENDADNPLIHLWYRLCINQRQSKPPSLYMSGEGESSFSPSMTFPGASDHLELICSTQMSTSDLIHDILVKTIELRTKIIMLRCTSAVYGVPVSASSIKSLAYKVYNKMMRRSSIKQEEIEAESSVMFGDHLLELLDIQNRRLDVWKAMLDSNQRSAKMHQRQGHCFDNQLFDVITTSSQFKSHRDAMDHLYYTLCRIIIAKIQSIDSVVQDLWNAGGTSPCIKQSADKIANQADASYNSDIEAFLGIVHGINFSESATLDVYTFSLTEVLLQFLQNCHSSRLSDYILNVIWPQIEKHGRGFEHSHYPTHIAKRLIIFMAGEMLQGRKILFATPVVPEDISKASLLDPNYDLETLLYGYNFDSGFFISRTTIG